MRLVTEVMSYSARPVPLAVTIAILIAGFSAAASSAGFTVQKINAPGPAVRMSSTGFLTGTYQASCTWVGNKPRHRLCYYAPWYFDGARVSRVSWPVDWNFVYSLGINDSLELVGREYRGSLSAGGWVYSQGTLTYSGSLPGGGGSVLAAINNAGVAVGTAQSAARVSRAVTFDTSGLLMEVPAFDATIPTFGADINDEGDIAGSYTGADGSQHAFAYVNGETIVIPDLPGATYCSAVRISQATNSGQAWVAGNCADRGFVFLPEGSTGQILELNNLDGLPGGVSVQSVNGWGEAVGTVGGKAVTWTANDLSAVDLNQHAPRKATFSRGIDINDAGMILAGDVDASGNVSTYLLTP